MMLTQLLYKRTTGRVVGHVPKELSRTMSFIMTDGLEITCQVTGHRKFGKGLEVPCVYKCIGNEKKKIKAMKKLHKIIKLMQ